MLIFARLPHGRAAKLRGERIQHENSCTDLGEPGVESAEPEATGELFFRMIHRKEATNL